MGSIPAPSLWPPKMIELLFTGCLGPHGEPVEVGINGDGLWGPEPEAEGPANKGGAGLGWGFLSVPKARQGRESAGVPNRIQEGLLPWGLSRLCSGAAGCLMRTGQPCSFLGLPIP